MMRFVRVICWEKLRLLPAAYFCRPVKLKKLQTYLSVVLVFFGLQSRILAQQLDPPVLNCLQVAGNGNVTLGLVPTSDPSGYFVEYQIFTSANQGAGYSFSDIEASINVFSTTHTTVASLTDNIYYYIQTISSDGTNSYQSITSDTLSTIWLTATPSPTGYAVLDWNTPFLPSYNVPTGLFYEVWREYPAGTWTMVQTMPYGVTGSNYEISEVCGANMNFEVRLTMPGGCVFTSNLAGGFFENYAPPIIPVITEISIDHLLNRAVISWEPSPSPDTEAYIIYKCVNGATLIVDTIWGINNTSFTDLLSGSAVSTGQVSYTIAAFDECYHGSPPSPNTSALGPCHSSIYLPNIGYGVCNSNLNLNWLAYDGWQDGTEEYIIYHALAPDIATPLSDLSFVPIDTVSGNVTNFSYLISDFNVYHCFYIVGVASVTGYQAISNYTRVLTPYPVPPAYLYLGSASVTSQDSTLVTLLIEPTPNIYQVKLERFNPLTLVWDEVIVLDTDGTGSLSMPDSQRATDAFSYTYRIITSNYCGDIIDTTNLGKTILLNGVTNEQRLVNTLVWTTYGDWDEGVEKYLIHRVIGELGTDEVVTEIYPGAQFFYDDEVADQLFTDGTFTYYIEAVEKNGPYATNSAFSNEVKLSQKPVIWIPNAFVVNGYNRTFNPVISFADFTEYQMIIYSRWGDIIFQSDDITIPWDGRMNGEIVQEGAYTYFMTVKDGKGKAYDHTGYVIVLVEK